jgi:hypothetical protein
MTEPEKQARFERAVERAMGHRNDVLRSLVDLLPLLEGRALDKALSGIEESVDPGEAALALAHVSRWLSPARKAGAVRSAVELALRLDDTSRLSVAFGGIVAELEGKWPETPSIPGLLADVLSRLLADGRSVHDVWRLEPVIGCLRSIGEPIPEVATVLLDALRRYQDQPRGQMIALLASGLFEPGFLRIDGATISRILAAALKERASL